MLISLLNGYRVKREIQLRGHISPQSFQYPYPKIDAPISKPIEVQASAVVQEEISEVDLNQCAICLSSKLELKQEGKFLVPCQVDSRHPPVCNICFTAQNISCVLLAQVHQDSLLEFPWGQP